MFHSFSVALGKRLPRLFQKSKAVNVPHSTGRSESTEVGRLALAQHTEGAQTATSSARGHATGAGGRGQGPWPGPYMLVAVGRSGDQVVTGPLRLSSQAGMLAGEASQCCRIREPSPCHVRPRATSGMCPNHFACEESGLFLGLETHVLFLTTNLTLFSLLFLHN